MAIGNRTGAGHSNQLQTYSFTDAQPLTNTAYYRLKQTDADGRYAYSKTIAVRCDQQIGVVKIYPNPGAGKFVLSGLACNANLQIINEQGKTVWSSKAAGEQVSINLQHQPPGMYWVIVQQNNIRSVSKLVIKR
jgi:hypothetical protein